MYSACMHTSTILIMMTKNVFDCTARRKVLRWSESRLLLSPLGQLALWVLTDQKPLNPHTTQGAGCTL